MATDNRNPNERRNPGDKRDPAAQRHPQDGQHTHDQLAQGGHDRDAGRKPGDPQDTMKR